MASTVRTVMGIKGEPATPGDPAHGLVWRAIVTQVDRAGTESAYVSVTDMPRATFARHPWSIGGGGAADLLGQINEASTYFLGAFTTAIGRTTHTGEDNVFYMPPDFCWRFGLKQEAVPLVEGEGVRDYSAVASVWTLFPYDKGTAHIRADLPDDLWRHFWYYRRLMKERKDFGNYIEDRGLRWYEHSMFFPERYRNPSSITFAFVATHNHFVLDRGGKVFKQTAPVIKLPANATEDKHLGLLGLLNSSVACFWGRQTFFPRGGFAAEKWEERLEWDSTKLQEFPLAEPQPLDLARKLDTLARELTDTLPGALLARADPRAQDGVPFPAQGQGGGRTPDPGAAPTSTTDSPRVPERGETGIKK